MKVGEAVNAFIIIIIIIIIMIIIIIVTTTTIPRVGDGRGTYSV